MSSWKDPDDPRLWWVIGPLLVFALVVLVFLAIEGAWLAIGVTATVVAYSAWASWQSGKPMWPGGPRRRA